MSQALADHPFTFLDVFTDLPLAGNGLAVVHDADDIDDATMLAFARETRLSETTFVQTATVAGADYRDRIWTPAGEIPFAGHPSLGTAAAVALQRRETAAHYVQQTVAGLQPIHVELDGAKARTSMLQEPALFGPEIDAARALATVGIGVGAAHPELPPQFVSTGAFQLLVAVSEPGSLGQAEPDYEALGPLLGEQRAIVLYLFHPDPAAGTAAARAFCFSAEMGEDPATGSAVGPLCAYLDQRLGIRRVEVTQGIEMGRPSRLLAELEEDRVRVTGEAVVLIEGTIHL